jgi:hypothetical protein
MRFPEPCYVVPGYIPEGLTILGGRPKVGKSWMALEMALGVSLVENVLGKIMPESGDVLYAALEDTFNRLQRRIKKLLWPGRKEWPERLMLATTWKRLDEGGVEDIDDWAQSVDAPRLVILDTSPVFAQSVIATTPPTTATIRLSWNCRSLPTKSISRRSFCTTRASKSPTLQ